MKTNQIIAFSLAGVILVGGGIFIATKYHKNNNTVAGDNYMNDEKSDQGSVTGDTSQNQSQTQSDANTNSPKDSVATQPGCTRSFNEDTLKNAKVDIQNRFVTLDIKDFGTVKVQLYDKDAPKAVENFVRLVNAGFYDCLTFHRIAKGFVIQGGDPHGDGTGGLSAFGGPFADELDPNTPSYKEGYKHGVLAMANSGKNTNSSQFFILLSDYPLDHAYTIFGKVTEGLDIVDKIGKVDIIPNPYMGPNDGAPKTPVVISKATLISK